LLLPAEWEWPLLFVQYLERAEKAELECPFRCSACLVRSQRRKIGAKAVDLQLIEALSTREILEPMFSKIAQVNFREVAIREQ
jgi:hypothetical protein